MTAARMFPGIMTLVSRCNQGSDQMHKAVHLSPACSGLKYVDHPNGLTSGTGNAQQHRTQHWGHDEAVAAVTCRVPVVRIVIVSDSIDVLDVVACMLKDF